ncbi:hypothetical protein COH20_009798 [Aspergillus flavus]|nr:hypothetical protein COH20_009798 [Aspergillus flavus]RAQ73293.1 hypothetical protein COH21_011247 [Aspergillus flavus]
MSTSRNPSHGRSRICNAAQMERKRILDREHQRLRRQKAKRLSEMIQAEMSDLRQDLTFALERLDRLYQLVARCTTFIREPTWVAVSGFSGFQPRRFEPDEKDRFTKDPKALHTFRRWLEHNANKTYPLFFARSEAQEEARNEFVNSMRDALKNPGLEERVIPPWAGPLSVGIASRLTPGVGYLESLNDLKTAVVYDEPRSYLGIAAAGYPNYYMFLAPNSPIGNGPVLVGTEAQADYICKHITRIQQQGIKSIEVTKEAVDDFIEHKDQYMKDMVWNEDCRSWCKGNTADGKIVALWPGSTLHYIDTLRQVRYEDFKVQYFGYHFSYLGNGMSKLEMAPDADLAYYIRQRDDAPIIGAKFVYKKAGPELTAINMTAAKASEETTTDVSRLKFTNRVRYICIPQAYLCIYTIESSPSLDNHPIRVQQ